MNQWQYFIRIGNKPFNVSDVGYQFRVAPPILGPIHWTPSVSLAIVHVQKICDFSTFDFLTLQSKMLLYGKLAQADTFGIKFTFCIKFTFVKSVTLVTYKMLLLFLVLISKMFRKLHESEQSQNNMPIILCQKCLLGQGYIITKF